MIAVFPLLPSAESALAHTVLRARPSPVASAVHDRGMRTRFSPRRAARLALDGAPSLGIRLALAAALAFAFALIPGPAASATADSNRERMPEAAPQDSSTWAWASAWAWAWPVPAPHPIARPFIAPENPYSAGHRGIDIGSASRTIVRSPADGVVHFSGFVVNRSLVSIDHGGGVLSSFEPVESELAEGTLVRRGDPIGVLQSGHCSTPCLHLGVRVHGQYVSPLNFLGGMEPSVLLPTRPLTLGDARSDNFL